MQKIWESLRKKYHLSQTTTSSSSSASRPEYSSSSSTPTPPPPPSPVASSSSFFVSSSLSPKKLLRKALSTSNSASEKTHPHLHPQEVHLPSSSPSPSPSASLSTPPPSSTSSSAVATSSPSSLHRHQHHPYDQQQQSSLQHPHPHHRTQHVTSQTCHASPPSPLSPIKCPACHKQQSFVRSLLSLTTHQVSHLVTCPNYPNPEENLPCNLTTATAGGTGSLNTSSCTTASPPPPSSSCHSSHFYSTSSSSPTVTLDAPQGDSVVVTVVAGEKITPVTRGYLEKENSSLSAQGTTVSSHFQNKNNTHNLIGSCTIDCDTRQLEISTCSSTRKSGFRSLSNKSNRGKREDSSSSTHCYNLNTTGNTSPCSCTCSPRRKKHHKLHQATSLPISSVGQATLPFQQQPHHQQQQISFAARFSPSRLFFSSSSSNSGTLSGKESPRRHQQEYYCPHHQEEQYLTSSSRGEEEAAAAKGGGNLIGDCYCENVPLAADATISGTTREENVTDASKVKDITLTKSTEQLFTFCKKKQLTRKNTSEDCLDDRQYSSCTPSSPSSSCVTEIYDPHSSETAIGQSRSSGKQPPPVSSTSTCTCITSTTCTTWSTWPSSSSSTSFTSDITTAATTAAVIDGQNDITPSAPEAQVVSLQVDPNQVAPSSCTFILAGGSNKSKKIDPKYSSKDDKCHSKKGDTASSSEWTTCETSPSSSPPSSPCYKTRPPEQQQQSLSDFTSSSSLPFNDAANQLQHPHPHCTCSSSGDKDNSVTCTCKSKSLAADPVTCVTGTFTLPSTSSASTGPGVAISSCKSILQGVTGDGEEGDGQSLQLNLPSANLDVNSGGLLSSSQATCTRNKEISNKEGGPFNQQSRSISCCDVGLAASSCASTPSSVISCAPSSSSLLASSEYTCYKSTSCHSPCCVHCSNQCNNYSRGYSGSNIRSCISSEHLLDTSRTCTLSTATTSTTTTTPAILHQCDHHHHYHNHHHPYHRRQQQHHHFQCQFTRQTAYSKNETNDQGDEDTSVISGHDEIAATSKTLSPASLSPSPSAVTTSSIIAGCGRRDSPDGDEDDDVSIGGGVGGGGGGGDNGNGDGTGGGSGRASSVRGEDLLSLGHLDDESLYASTVKVRSKSFDVASSSGYARSTGKLTHERGSAASSVTGVGPSAASSAATVISSTGSVSCLTNAGRDAISTVTSESSTTRTGRRSRASGVLLELPKFKMFIRRSSAAAASGSSSSSSSNAATAASGTLVPSSSSPTVSAGCDGATTYYFKDCVHCMHLEEQAKQIAASVTPPPPVSSVSLPHYNVRGKSGSFSSEGSQDPDDRIHSVRSPSPSDIVTASGLLATGEQDSLEEEDLIASHNSTCHSSKAPSPVPVVTLSMPPPPSVVCYDSEQSIVTNEEEDLGNGVTVISLEVPVLPKSGRSASMDSSYLQVPKRNDILDFEPPPGKSNRSRSVDIALPVGTDGPYIVVPSEKQVPPMTQKAIHGEIKISTENGETRTLRCAPDWGESAINGDHLWVPTSASGDLCYVGDSECSKQGPRLCCPVCKITAHTGCIGILIDKIKIQCRPTFKDVGVRQYREQTVIHHHWVHRRHQKGRCKHCGKSFQSKLSFGSKEIVALSCSWCKSSYHNKEPCFTIDRLSEMCDLGPHGDLIIPPSWIVKLPRKGSFKSSIRRSPKSSGSAASMIRSSSKRRCKKELNSTSTTAGSGTLTGFTADTSSLSGDISSPSLRQGTPPSSSSSSNVAATCSVVSTQQSEQMSQSTEICSGVVISTSSPNTTSESAGLLLTTTTNESPCGPAVGSIGERVTSEYSDLLTMKNISTSSSGGSYQPSAFGTSGVTNTTCSTTTPPRCIEVKKSHLFATSATVPVPSSNSSHRSFTIKPIPSSTTKPLLVFINPKSGGNQGTKLIQKFQWLLNPRQVFDLSQAGPKVGLELYRKVPNLRILACGGDGTIGWIFSALDELGIKPSVAVLPLGTGNDLARAFGWGGSYTDEPLSKILFNVRDGEVVQLDRWDLIVERNYNISGAEIQPDRSSTSSGGGSGDLLEDVKFETTGASETLPTNVINNYFSIGVDAHIALEFHEAREAHPEKFNSRLRNKMFYGQAGGKDLLQRKWKDLCNYITLECDGVDLTQRLKDLKVHSLLFLNIPSYGGGTRPWSGNSPIYEVPRTDDGLIEVIGLTTYQLPLLQAGGHGSCIAQCRSACIITTRTIPMQVDGEPCRLLPSVIHVKLRNQANVIAKAKTHTQPIQKPILEKVTLSVRKLSLSDYETYHYEKDRLKQASIHLGHLKLKPNIELDRVRNQINASFNYPSVGGEVESGIGAPTAATATVTATAVAVASASASPASASAAATAAAATASGGGTVECTLDVTNSTVNQAPGASSPADHQKYHQQGQSRSFSSSLSTEDSISTPTTGPMLLVPSEDDSIDMQFVRSSADPMEYRLSSDWCFIDSCTAERFFRIDRAQEHLHYVVDICNEELYILDSGESESQSFHPLQVPVSETGDFAPSFTSETPPASSSAASYPGQFSSASPSNFLTSSSSDSPNVPGGNLRSSFASFNTDTSSTLPTTTDTTTIDENVKDANNSNSHSNSNSNSNSNNTSINTTTTDDCTTARKGTYTTQNSDGITTLPLFSSLTPRQSMSLCSVTS